MSYVLSVLLVMTPPIPTQEPACPRWIGDSNAVAPPGVTLSQEQKRANLLRCYWAIMKPKEQTCLRNSRTRGQIASCEAKTQRWLQSNFVWQGSPQPLCSPSPAPVPTTLRLNIRSVY